MEKIKKQKVETRAGYKAYRVSATDSFVWGGVGICDHCVESKPEGVLLPIINSWICNGCFNEWDDNSSYYPEDIPIETKRDDYYKMYFEED